MRGNGGASNSAGNKKTFPSYSSANVYIQMYEYENTIPPFLLLYVYIVYLTINMN